EALGLAVQSVPDAKTIFVDSTTEEQQRKLEELGYTVQHMPDGSVKITLNDDQARTQIQELVKPEVKTVTVSVKEAKAALGPYAGLYDPAPKAEGGPITGGIPGRDSVPILGMPGEHMLTTSDVDKLGGQAGVYRFRSALQAGRVRPMAAGGAIMPQAELPGHRSDDELDLLDAEYRIDQANTKRNQIYDEPTSTEEEGAAAARDYSRAQNAR